MTQEFQEQWQWQHGPQFQTYESFSQIMQDMPHGPVVASIVVASLPFIIYLFWKKRFLRTSFITPAAFFLGKWRRYTKNREMDRRVRGEYEEMVGRTRRMGDLMGYGIYLGMVILALLILKKAFFFSLVVSQSMMPTLMESDMVLVESMTTGSVEVGDILVFTPPGQETQVVHRAVSVEGERIKTKGDNIGAVDDWVLTSKNIDGKVVSVNGNPVVVKNFGTYFMPRRIYILGSDPTYEFIRSTVQKVHTHGPIILIVLLLLALVSVFEGKKRRYGAAYE